MTQQTTIGGFNVYNLIFLIAFATLGFAQDEAPVVVVPKPEPAKWLELTGSFPLTRLAVPGDKPAKWELIDSVDAELDACEAGKKASLVVKREGRYRILLTTDAGAIRLAVTVGKIPAPPDVIPPLPVDPLVVKLQALYTADPSPSKAAELKILTALYSGAADLVAGANRPATVADLLTRLRASAAALGVTGLDAMRKVVAEELKLVFPIDGPLDGPAQAKAIAVLTRVRDTLKQVKE